jgi:hypothetical protein
MKSSGTAGFIAVRTDAQWPSQWNLPASVCSCGRLQPDAESGTHSKYERLFYFEYVVKLSVRTKSHVVDGAEARSRSSAM